MNQLYNSDNPPEYKDFEDYTDEELDGYYTNKPIWILFGVVVILGGLIWWICDRIG